VVSLDLRPGTLFHSRYEIVGGLGQGGMGVVYQARDRTLDETVAIKILRPDFAQDPKMAERFKTEIKLARRVHHRNVCAIHDFGEDQGLLYISMELIEGRDLKQLLREQHGLPPDQAYDISIQVAEGLQAVHDAGIVHRDLKTPNIMLDSAGVARLMDFGVAKRMGQGTLTATGHILGTPEYMSPEQAQGHKVDSRSDLYALGVVVWETFTGHVPFRGETPISTILKQIHDAPPLDGPDGLRLPPALRPVLTRALAKDPADRYQTAREMAEALREARSPSRRQQPIATDALRSPTLPLDNTATEHMAGPRPRPRRWPRLLTVPLVAIAAGFALLTRSVERPQTAATIPPAVPQSVPSASAAPPSTLPATLGVAAEPRPSPTAASAHPRPVARPTAAPTTPVTAVASVAPSSVASAPTAAAPVATPPSAPGLLQVAVVPWGTVFVDGREMGDTPLDRISLPAGSHTVRIRHPAFEVVERQVTIVPGQTERIVVNLTKDGRRKP
jgi:serine/threonine-protein kinase